MGEALNVQVVFLGGAGKVLSKGIQVEQGTSLRQAVELSGLQVGMSAVDFAQCRLGVWGKVRPEDSMACDGDRIELYRPLKMDPKIARARRARKKLKQ
jgi:uncharacterized protein